MASKIGSRSPTIKRIMREAQELSTTPSPDYAAAPLETDLFEWHFTLRGPPGSPFEEGLYHGRIVLPPTYPLRPPSFRFLTPSGRFETNREICLSISGHHEETWQPAWGVRTALVALRSFMETDPKGQLGGLATGDDVRRALARESREWRCGGCGGRTNGDIIRESEEAARAADAEAGDGEGSSTNKSKEVEVPAELRLGFRDEMEKAASAAGGGASVEAAAHDLEDAESAELAEGFVQTVPRAELDSAASSIAASLGAQPGQAVLQPTRTVPLPNAAHNTAVPGLQAQLRQQQQQQQQTFNDGGVPKWVDRVIVALAVCLFAMILKVFLGY
ncbi:hypothetical protein VPNG_02393 [Cytospora leucostoma]|uniref:UBC core domain-containing protein n=1 Tax=Cytospora leucostoma TaxID=1230097 RepID=A0A423XHL1_9PEZI|nr:hypothetical protein VPNG_02393 [Cytospora leucostoma]